MLEENCFTAAISEKHKSRRSISPEPKRNEIQN